MAEPSTPPPPTPQPESESAGSTKDSRKRTFSEDSDLFEEAEIPCDLVASMLLFLEMIPKAPQFPRAVLKHQLYTVLTNRTTVDRRVEELVAEHKIFEFMFDESRHETWLMMRDDYHALVHRAAAAQPQVGQAFLQYLDSQKAPLFIQQGSIADVEDKTLMQMGLLTLRDATTGWVRVPGMGALVSAVRDTRTELLRAISLSKYKEVLEPTILKRKLRKTVLPAAFHIADLVGGDYVIAVPSASGRLLRQFVREARGS
eukprot:m.49766 g.49766  ORF g.49766 m.49766 type:complete len:258 (-) comp11517_c0_seq2:64-837(-)